MDEGLATWIYAALRDEPAERPTLAALVVLLERFLKDALKLDSRSGDVHLANLLTDQNKGRNWNCNLF